MITRRRFIHSVAVLAALLVAADAAAEGYPSRPVRVISPAPAGGNADAVARTVFERVAATLGQPFVIENVPGAAGNIGMERAAAAPGDGYTLVEVITANTINQTLYPGLSFDLEKSFVPRSCSRAWRGSTSSTCPTRARHRR